MFSRLKKLISGGPAASGNRNQANRLSAYVEELGEPEHVFPAKAPDAVEVLAFGRDFSPTAAEDEGYVLLTSGMSDRCMTMPAGAGSEAKRRAELMWYVREPTPDIVANLRWLAQYSFIDDTWLGFGHRIPMPEPPVRGTQFRTFLFLTPIIAPDERIAEALKIENDDVEILTVNLISDAEYRAILDDGLDSFLDVLDENDHPAIFDPARKSYV